jgi:hypothetical protein
MMLGATLNVAQAFFSRHYGAEGNSMPDMRRARQDLIADVWLYPIAARFLGMGLSLQDHPRPRRARLGWLADLGRGRIAAW